MPPNPALLLGGWVGVSMMDGAPEAMTGCLGAAPDPKPGAPRAFSGAEDRTGEPDATALPANRV